MEFAIIDLGEHVGSALHLEPATDQEPFRLTWNGVTVPMPPSLKERRAEARIRQLETDLAIARADQARAEDARQWVGENCAGLAQQRDEATREVTELRTILRDIRAALGVKDGGDAVVTAKALYENLGAVQRRCSELLDECRGWRARMAIPSGHSPLGTVLGAVVAERFRQDLKWGPVGPNHLDRPDLRSDIANKCDRVSAANWRRGLCDNAAALGLLTWEHILDEEWAEACAESEPAKLRAELVQVAAVACSWVQAIDMREERKSVERQAERGAQASLDRIAAIRAGDS